MPLRTVTRAASAGLVLAGLFAASVPATSRAATIFSSFGPSDSYDTTKFNSVTGSAVAPGAPASVSVGGLFTASAAASVTGADLALKYIGGTDSLFLSFWTDVGGLPGVQLGGTFTVTPPATAGVVAVTGITGVSVAAGGSYFLELAPGGVDTDAIWWANDQGLEGLILNTGHGWTNDLGDSLLPAFDVTTAAAVVAEPVSASLLLSGLAGMAMVRRRGRRTHDEREFTRAA